MEGTEKGRNCSIDVSSSYIMKMTENDGQAPGTARLGHIKGRVHTKMISHQNVGEYHGILPVGFVFYFCFCLKTAVAVPSLGDT